MRHCSQGSEEKEPPTPTEYRVRNIYKISTVAYLNKVLSSIEIIIILTLHLSVLAFLPFLLSRSIGDAVVFIDSKSI
jgi:hypothetical protein